MADKQKTFGDLFGLESEVPSGAHRDDWIECSDGTFRNECDIYRDCRDVAHGSEEDCHGANVEIVTEVLNGVGKGADEYCTENSDYASAYDHIIDEVSHEWPKHVEKWIRNEYHDYMGHGRFDDCMEALVAAVCEHLQGSFDCEAEYSRSEYAAYSGSGCCLWGTDIGEHEEQIDITCHDELKALHDEGMLDTVLDDVNCDVYISRSKRRERDPITGHYKEVGQETYDPYGGSTTFEVYSMPGGRWDWVVPAERMRELVSEAICDLARKETR
jgi:hypothetical protein